MKRHETTYLTTTRKDTTGLAVIIEFYLSTFPLSRPPPPPPLPSLRSLHASTLRNAHAKGITTFRGCKHNRGIMGLVGHAGYANSPPPLPCRISRSLLPFLLLIYSIVKITNTRSQTRNDKEFNHYIAKANK